MSEENTKQETNQAIGTPGTAATTATIAQPQAPIVAKESVLDTLTAGTKSTESETPVDNVEDLKEDELTALKNRARTLGVTFHPNIGLDTLREKINLKLRSGDLKDVTTEAGVPNPNDVEASEPVTDYTAEEIVSGYAQAPAVKLSKAQMRNEAIKNANKLVRVRINCMNPNKRDWSGEIITVANAVVGTFRKYIPFNNTEGYHVPQIILQAIRERQCQIFVNGTNTQGQRIKRPTLINEFAVEVLEPLTVNELKELAQRQAMANGTAR